MPEFPLPSRPLRIAAVQARITPGDVTGNALMAADLVWRSDARVTVLPEAFLGGYELELISSDPARYAVSAGDPRLDPIARACESTGTSAIVGAVVSEDGALFVSSLVFGPSGEVLARYDKQFLTSIERRYCRPGAAGCTVEIDTWRLALGICYDCGFSEHARAAAKDGAHAYLVSALFSAKHGFHESRTWLPARALENTAYVVVANHTGRTGGWHGCGGSAVWAPDGRLLAQAAHAETAVVRAELDPDLLADVRRASPLLVDVDVPERSALRARTEIRL